MRKVHARFTSVGAIALAVSISTTAMAEEPASGYAPPAYPSKAGAQTHDGFYLRMGLGLGYLSAKDKLEFSFGNTTSSGDATISGTGVSGEFALGGTVAPGLVLGGASQFGVFPKPKVSSGGQSVTADNGVVLSSLGFLIDYYIDPKDGFHIQGLVGYATLQSTNSSNNSKTPSGLALSAGVGKEWWVGDEWSVGILGRVQYVNAKADYGLATETITAFVPAVMATFTYHLGPAPEEVAWKFEERRRGRPLSLSRRGPSASRIRAQRRRRDRTRAATAGPSARAPSPRGAASPSPPGTRAGAPDPRTDPGACAR